MDSRIWLRDIDSSGTFRSGDIRLDIVFEDSEGKTYTWYPEWDDIRKLYAEAERVEEVNPTGDKELENLKEFKQLDTPVIDQIAKIIAETWTGDRLGRFFRELGYDTEFGYQVEEHATTFPAETGGREKNQNRFCPRTAPRTQ
jgi:hypothetical protein